MKQVNNFNDFLVNLILEDENKKFHGVTELPFVLSDDLKKLLKTINHPIATKLLEIDKERTDKKVTMVDLDEKDYNKITLLNSNKAYDNLFNQFKKNNSEVEDGKVENTLKTINLKNRDLKEYEWWTKNRATVKLGSFIGKVFPNEYKQGGNPGQDIESFVQSVIAKRNFLDNPVDNFKIVKGDDIIKYYNYKMNDTSDIDGASVGGPLAGSCMRNDSCADYVNFYAQNKDVSMLVLFSDNDNRKEKIVGRAILWELSSPSGRTFMDRIYYRYESDMAAFKQYAEKNGWLYKNSQNMSYSERIVDSKTGESNYMNLKTLSTFEQTQYYPYMDTMKWFYIDQGYLTNDEDIIDGEEVYFLESTGGGYQDAGEEDHDGQTYVEYYDEWVDDDELIYCDLGEEYRRSDDSVYCEYYDQDATTEYVDRNMVYSEYESSYLEDSDAVHSDVMDDHIPENNAVPVYGGADGDFEDVYDTDDVTHEEDDYYTIVYKGKDKKTYNFNKDDKNYFIKVSIGPDGWRQEYKHKVWDKDKIFKVDGKWYFEYDTKVKDKLIGQTRM